QFVEAVNQRIGRRARRQRAAIGRFGQQLLFHLAETEQLGGLRRLRRLQLHLAEQPGSEKNRRLLGIDLLADLLPAPALHAFHVEDLFGHVTALHVFLRCVASGSVSWPRRRRGATAARAWSPRR